MRRLTPAVLALLLGAAPAFAQFTTAYSGKQLVDKKWVPATAQFSVEKGRVAAIMTGSRSSRMLFLEKEGVLRVIDDATKSYLDLDQKTMSQLGAGGDEMEKMKKQMESMPPEQRKMAEQMMGSVMGSVKTRPPTTYVWTKEKQTIKGYECTKVECMVGEDKRSEYWGSTSADFKMSNDERSTMLAMQGYLRNFLITVSMGPGAGDGQSRAFEWDTSQDGYPLITRCFAHGDTTLDLYLQTIDHKPLSKDLFETPDGYKKQDLMGGMEGKGGKHPHTSGMKIGR